MSVSVNSRRTRLRSALAVLLTVLVLLPAAGLLLRVLQENSKQRDNVQLEQDGTEYLNALVPLISALAESQSAALQGVAAEPASVTAAVSRVQIADDKFGKSLETTSRWTGLKAKIAKLPAIGKGTAKIFTAHVEVADLTLALFDTVRENSTLNRDPDADIWFLQDVVAEQAPVAVTAVSRMSDLANMVVAASSKTREPLKLQFAYQVQKVQEVVGDLTDGLQEAVNDTNSDTLSGNLVSNLDSFRRGIEAANRGANFGAGKPDVSVLVTAQSTLQTALSALSGVVLKEMAGLLDDRSDTLTYKRIEAFAVFGVAFALIVVATLWTRGRARQVQAALSEQPGENRRDVSVQAAGATGGSAPANPYGNNPYDQAPSYGEIPNYGGGRERSGAVR
ncbi:hypothetical protein [Actinoplanes regularis]|uniref:Uncharacterized protein n=1 Tax=Actinoplanes regularis TaxID=52697 RepID=A0A239ASP7_9ACTN|nr:hypothetical protein [Actinoplanes regularis]GIE87390.1 hypothetical protein Are01nite_38700 [Actinoplanes regularis]SNR98570.1 hypothetical protein SAMN06264365_10896 [Actinoplanes regularis]